MASEAPTSFEIYGSITLDGSTFDSAIRDTITSGDGAYLTVGLLWDFKVIKSKLNQGSYAAGSIYHFNGIRPPINQSSRSISKLGFF